MPEAVPAAAPVPPVTPTTPPPAKPASGMEAALQLVAGVMAQRGPPPPTPAAAQSPAPAATPPPAAAKPTDGAAPPNGAQKPPPPQDPVARALAINARKERQLLDQARALKAEQASLAEMRKQVDAQVAEMQARLQRAEEAEAQRTARRQEYLRDPRLVLQDTGIDFQALAQAILNDGAPNPELLARALDQRVQQATDATQKRLEAIEKQREEDRKAAEAARTQASQQEQEQAIALIRQDITETVTANPEKFEMITLFGAQDLIFKAIETHYQETGKELTPMQAAEKVEAYLDSEVERVGQSKRWASRFKPKETPPPAGQTPAGAPPPAAAPVTLGNVPQGGTAPVRKGGNPDWAAAEDVIRRAMPPR